MFHHAIKSITPYRPGSTHVIGIFKRSTLSYQIVINHLLDSLKPPPTFVVPPYRTTPCRIQREILREEIRSALISRPGSKSKVGPR
ncbi:hypothetical protein EVAR_24854_1 [Eumeta japonica]|uniref:Uncharacterized protein n=1 Tax=Eumeta variegata TaxID=151549 RepID=A0A4C1Y8L4_EUMVA|nr:hypothetical protein EVAR_24854_1 [Eumeta japonica]